MLWTILAIVVVLWGLWLTFRAGAPADLADSAQ